MRSRTALGGGMARRGGTAMARAALVLAATASLTGTVLAGTGLAGTGSATAHAAAPAAPAAAHASTRSAAARARPAAAGLAHDYRRACAVTRRTGRMACMALVRTNVAQQSAAILKPHAAPSGVGYGPASLQSAYNLPSTTAGSGQTVAVVDAYDYPAAAADLAAYRSAWGLPACGAGCFQKVNQDGQSSPLPAASGSSGWATEASLDVDMVSAICPQCHIILVEANAPTIADLGTAVNTAVTMGARYVSNSYGGSQSSSDPSYDTSYFRHQGVAVTASAGDSGYGVAYPATSQYVTAVGGTSLTSAANARGWAETAWGSSSGGEGTGSGCAAYDAKPSWQADTGCARRTDDDVAAVADPNTGVAVYDSYDQNGWLEVGGTSASSPIIASTFALAGTPAPNTYPSSYPYAHTSSLYDVTSGADGSCGGSYLCTARTGYDGPTGWGTPNGTAAFSSSSSGNTVTVAKPGAQAGTVGTAASLQISASDSDSGQTLTYSATGLPAGLSISPSTGLISGTPTTAHVYTVTVTATDGTQATGSASFGWTVSAAGCTAQQLLGNPGFETGTITPWTSTPGVLTAASGSVPANSGSWLARLDGYGRAHTDTLAQTVTIPSACQNATLSFWLRIITNAQASRARDTLSVQVLQAGGSVLATLASYSNRSGSGGYAQHTFSLSSYIGQTITIRFTGRETLTGHSTSFLDDDNALRVS